MDVLLSTLPALEKDLKSHGARRSILLKILKGIVELSRNADGIETLMANKTVASVCPFLYTNDVDIQTCVIMVLFYMTLVPQRSGLSACEEAAMNGAIPRLKEFIKFGHKAMYFLVVTICKFTKNASEKTMYELKKHDMTQFYLNMTKRKKSVLTQMSAITALSEWIQYEQYIPLLEFVLCRPDNVTQLISVFGLPVDHRMKQRLIKQKTQSGNITDLLGQSIREFTVSPSTGPVLDQTMFGSKKTSTYSNTYTKSIPALLNAFSDMTRVSQKLAILLGGSDLFLATLGEWLHATFDESFDITQTKQLLLMVRDLFANLDPTTQKKFVQVILPVIDAIVKTKSQRQVIRAIIENQLIKRMWMSVDDFTMGRLSQHTKMLIAKFEAELAK